MAEEKWMQGAFRPSRKGLLHKQLGVPEDENIPKEKMNAAVKGKFGELARKRAQAAKNANQ